MNTYAVLKLFHVLAVITWLGGALNMTLLTWRISRSGDRAAIYLVLLLTVVGAMVLKPTV